jgi:hypothetical protein
VKGRGWDGALGHTHRAMTPPKKSLHDIPNENLVAARKKIVLMNVARVGNLVLLLSLYLDLFTILEKKWKISLLQIFPLKAKTPILKKKTREHV